MISDAHGIPSCSIKLETSACLRQQKGSTLPQTGCFSLRSTEKIYTPPRMPVTTGWVDPRMQPTSHAPHAAPPWILSFHGAKEAKTAIGSFTFTPKSRDLKSRKKWDTWRATNGKHLDVSKNGNTHMEVNEFVGTSPKTPSQ